MQRLGKRAVGPTLVAYKMAPGTKRYMCKCIHGIHGSATYLMFKMQEYLPWLAWISNLGETCVPDSLVASKRFEIASSRCHACGRLTWLRFVAFPIKRSRTKPR